MTRVKQFADDLGISKDQAQSLINKGRSRKDGGSQILENVMKPKGYLAGGSVLSSTKKDSKAIKKKENYTVDDDLSLKKLFGDTSDGKVTLGPDSKMPYDKKYNPDQYHKTLNPRGTKGRPESEDQPKPRPKVLKKNKKAMGGLPDLTGRGVPGFSRGGGMAVQGLGFKGVR